MAQRDANTPVVLSLSAAVVLWGANNVALKQVLGSWPPLFTGATRFMTAGLLMLVLSAGTRIFGVVPPPPSDRKRALWRAGLVLALYIAACNWTLRFLPASQFALHMAASPAWALMLEGLGAGSWSVRLRRWAAVLLTFSGVFVLLLPSLRSGGEWIGQLPPAEVHTVARHLFCITLGGVVPFALWTQALTRWPVSRVALFGNLIPLSTTAWAFVTLGEPLSPTFGLSTLLILGGVLLGQVDWTRILGRTWVPEE